MVHGFIYGRLMTIRNTGVAGCIEAETTNKFYRSINKIIKI